MTFSFPTNSHSYEYPSGSRFNNNYFSNNFHSNINQYHHQQQPYFSSPSANGTYPTPSYLNQNKNMMAAKDPSFMRPPMYPPPSTINMMMSTPPLPISASPMYMMPPVMDMMNSYNHRPAQKMNPMMYPSISYLPSAHPLLQMPIVPIQPPIRNNINSESFEKDFVQPSPPMNQQVKSSQKTQQRAKKPKVEPVCVRCDPCDRVFTQERQYQEHVAAHKKCSECDFEAGKKIISLHEEEVHQKILGGNKLQLKSKENPEEIAKWIEERKKNYPTESNVERKKAELEEKIAKGEVDPNEDKKKNKNKGGKKRKRDENTNANENNEEAIEAEGSSVKSTKKKRLCKYFMRGSCKRGEECTFAHEKKGPRKERRVKTEEKQSVHKRMNLFRMLAHEEEIEGEEKKETALNNDNVVESSQEKKPLIEEIQSSSEEEEEEETDEASSDKSGSFSEEEHEIELKNEDIHREDAPKEQSKSIEFGNRFPKNTNAPINKAENQLQFVQGEQSTPIITLSSDKIVSTIGSSVVLAAPESVYQENKMIEDHSNVPIDLEEGEIPE